MAERPNAADLKSVEGSPLQGFKSLSLRHYNKAFPGGAGSAFFRASCSRRDVGKLLQNVHYYVQMRHICLQ